MRLVISILLLLSLLACATMPSKYPLPLEDIAKTGKFREDPPIKVFWLTGWEVQDVCAKINGMGNGIIAASLLVWFQGCAKVPFEPDKDCVVICKKGDNECYEHEYKHCEGHAD